MSCAKKKVECVIVAPRGESFVGENSCNNPQEVCPRLPGEGYEKCKSICDQPDHAETAALKLAGGKVEGGVAYIYGIDHLCKDCQQTLVQAGIKTFVIK